MTLRPATTDDLPLLAAMNHRLIKDEGSRNPMTLAQLQERMAGWLAGNWQVSLFVLADSAIVGYAVYETRPDEYRPDEQRYVCLRQFFVEREYRGQGIGRRAFELLTATFPPDAPVVLEVLARNPAGRRFWERVGFSDYAVTMKR